MLPSMQARTISLSILVAAISVGGLFLWLFSTQIPYEAAALPIFDREVPIEDKDPFRLIFTGDVMLARDVERRLMNEEKGYALTFLQDRFKGSLVVANFESSVPEIHQPTKNMEMRFSVRPEMLTELSLGSVTHLSLANNHALDHGEAGYRNTMSVLESLGLMAAGHPVTVSSSSVFLEKAGKRKVAIVNINATYRYPSLESVKEVIPSGLETDDLLVAYIHWGEEYEPIHNRPQESFAHGLIDSGFDLVVGHHPHVVQDVELYGQGLIFYSLGNFIFDQYWQPEVRQGLLLDLTEGQQGWQIELVPVESQTAHVQPREMAGEERNSFLKGLADRSSANLRSDIAKGLISLQF